MRSIVGLLILLVIAGTIGALLWSRRSRDEIHSIESYRNALDTLQEMRGPTASASVRVLDPAEQQELRQPTTPEQFTHHEPVAPPPPAVAPPPGSHDGMVFREDIGRSGHGEDHDQELHRGHDAPAWAISRMEPRHPVQNRQLIVGLVAGIAILLLVIVGVVIGGGGTGDDKATTTTAPRRTTTTSPRTTTTTSPKVSAYAPQSSTATTATYSIPTSTYSVTVKATGGSIWTIVTKSGSGEQVFAGSIDPGSPQTFKVSGGVDVNLGAPGYASVSIDRIPVTFPTGYQSPLILTFTPVPPTPPTTAPPSTTTTTTIPVTTTTRPLTVP